MDAISFFSKLRKQVKFHSSKPLTCACDSDHLEGTSEWESDGFVVLEKNATTNSRPKIENEADGHSSYHQDTHERTQPHPDWKLSPDESSTQLHEPSALSAVTDVPMQLHPTLATRMQINSLFDGIDLSQRALCPTKYSYDFINEELCLRDLNPISSSNYPKR